MLRNVQSNKINPKRQKHIFIEKHETRYVDRLLLITVLRECCLLVNYGVVVHLWFSYSLHVEVRNQCNKTLSFFNGKTLKRTHLTEIFNLNLIPYMQGPNNNLDNKCIDIKNTCQWFLHKWNTVVKFDIKSKYQCPTCNVIP